MGIEVADKDESELDIIADAIDESESESEFEWIVDEEIGEWGSDETTDPKFFDDSLTPPDVGMED